MTTQLASPPAFEEARNQRQRVRAAGLNPNYWYAVEQAHAVKKGQVVEVVFQGTSIALYRGMDGVLHALENRCAHRQLKLSLGVVEGCNLTCVYHGWSYDGSGKVVGIAHDLFGKPKLRVQVKNYPVAERYGLVWLFPGDPKLSTVNKIPEIPELEGPNRWACVPVDFTWKAHHSMIIDNVSDFTHAYLHRKYQPFQDAKLVHHEAVGDKVVLRYHSAIGRGKISGLFVDRRNVDTNSITLGYEYPYQWSDTGSKIKHWLFVLPIDERTTRAFFLFYFDAFVVPFTPLRIPRWFMTPFLKLSNRLLIKPLLSEDGIAVEAEQLGYEKHFDAPMIEINPVVDLFQQLTIRKWEEHLAQGEPARREAAEACASCS